MSGEHGAEATEHTKRFAELLSKFGWSARGRIDQNIDCQKCRKKANGNPAQHGVDGLFTFECPFSGKERGVVVDGKRHAMDSVGGPARLTGYLHEVINTLVHLRESPDTLQSDLQIAPSTSLDTAIVAWYCHEGWQSTKAAEWIRKVTLTRPRYQSILGFIAANDILHRLQSLVHFQENRADLEFYYFSIQGVARWSHVLTPEMLFSRMQIFRYRTLPSNPYRHGVFYYDVDKPHYIRFLLKLVQAHLATHSEIEIWPLCSNSHLTKLKAEFGDELARQGSMVGLNADLQRSWEPDHGPSGPKFFFSQLAETRYNV